MNIYEGQNYTTTLEDVQNALIHINLGHNDFDLWWKTGAAIYSEFPGDDGLMAFDYWSSCQPKYDPSAVKTQWRGFKNVTKIKIGTLFYHARLNGYKSSNETSKPAQVYTPQRITVEETNNEPDKDYISLIGKHTVAFKEQKHDYIKFKELYKAELCNIGFIEKKKAMEILNGYQNINRLDGDLLVIPMYHHGKITNYQLIGECSGKAFIKGYKCTERYWTHRPIDNLFRPENIYISEGVATCLSFVECCGIRKTIGVAALGKHNLAYCAKYFSSLYPKVPIYILADKKSDSPDPIKEAVEAAMEARCRLTVPHFKNDPDSYTDFNDLYVDEGRNAVKDCFINHINYEPQKFVYKGYDGDQPQEYIKTPQQDYEDAKKDLKKEVKNDDGKMVIFLKELRRRMGL